MTDKLYAERDAEAQGQYYLDHIMAMTGEDLYSKSAIAAELAHRDIQIAALQLKIEQLQNGEGEYNIGAFQAFRGEGND